VLDALFPLVCPGCGRRGDPVCTSCAELLRPAFPAPPPPGVDVWGAAFAYEGVAREVVARVKYRGARAAVPWLAEAMVGALPPPSASAIDVAVVTWAPTSRERRRRRGFDPAELLARAVARRLGARCVGLLERVPGPPQTGRTGADRRRGPRYTSRRVQPVVPAAVVLVDDVATTGATLTAASAALRDGGARVVVAITAARTPPPRRS
jgi:predicted amidophosphoribosyltransferase